MRLWCNSSGHCETFIELLSSEENYGISEEDKYKIALNFNLGADVQFSISTPTCAHKPVIRQNPKLGNGPWGLIAIVIVYIDQYWDEDMTDQNKQFYSCEVLKSDLELGDSRDRTLVSSAHYRMLP